MAAPDRSLVVAAIVKNNAKTIGRNLRRLYRLKKRLDRLSFVVFENGSTDDTASILRGFAERDGNFHFQNEDLPLSRQYELATVRHIDGRPCRLEIIAYARNKVRDFVAENLSDHAALLLFDGDIAWFGFKGAVRAMERVLSSEADCVCANGMTKWGGYRDAFAFRSDRHPYGPEFLGSYWWDVTRRDIQKPMRGKNLVPVYSAFGGAAVYGMSAYVSSRYTALPDSAFMDRQGALDHSRADPEEVSRASKDPLPNTNFVDPVVCEHVPFHYAMRERGFDRIYVDPAWRMLFWD